MLASGAFESYFMQELLRQIVPTYAVLAGVIVKKGTAYSALGAVIIFLFAFSEHLIATYLAGVAGALSEYLHFVSIAIVLVAFMPVKRRVDRFVEGYFTTKRVVVEF